MFGFDRIAGDSGPASRLTYLLTLLCEDAPGVVDVQPDVKTVLQDGWADGALASLVVLDQDRFIQLGYLLFLLWLHEHRRRMSSRNRYQMVGLDEGHTLMLYRAAHTPFVLAKPKGVLIDSDQSLEPFAPVTTPILPSGGDALLCTQLRLLDLNAAVGGVEISPGALYHGGEDRDTFKAAIDGRLRQFIGRDERHGCLLGGSPKVFPFSTEFIDGLINTDSGDDALEQTGKVHSKGESQDVHEQHFNAWLALRAFSLLRDSVGLAADRNPLVAGVKQGHELDAVAWSQDRVVLMETHRGQGLGHFKNKTDTLEQLVAMHCPCRYLYLHCDPDLFSDPASEAVRLLNHYNQCSHLDIRHQDLSVAELRPDGSLNAARYNPARDDQENHPFFEPSGPGLRDAFDRAIQAVTAVCRD